MDGFGGCDGLSDEYETSFPIYNKIWAEYFSENPPCRTTVEVTALPTPIAIELKCLAALKEV